MILIILSRHAAHLFIGFSKEPALTVTHFAQKGYDMLLRLVREYNIFKSIIGGTRRFFILNYFKSESMSEWGTTKWNWETKFNFTKKAIQLVRLGSGMLDTITDVDGDWLAVWWEFGYAQSSIRTLVSRYWFWLCQGCHTLGEPVMASISGRKDFKIPNAYVAHSKPVNFCVWDVLWPPYPCEKFSVDRPGNPMEQ